MSKTETAAKTGMMIAKEAYEQILSIKQSYAGLPTAEEEVREHERVYWERVKVIYDVYHVAYFEGAEDAKR